MVSSAGQCTYTCYIDDGDRGENKILTNQNDHKEKRVNEKRKTDKDGSMRIYYVYFRHVISFYSHAIYIIIRICI